MHEAARLGSHAVGIALAMRVRRCGSLMLKKLETKNLQHDRVVDFAARL